jgi:hypothetical protein
MKIMAILLAAAATTAVGGAFAQYPDYRYDRDWAQHRDDGRYRDNDRWRYDNRDWRDSPRDDWECWNPHAGHFEGVRPGERQDDLDFSRCRPKEGQVLPYPGSGYYGGWR